MKDDTQKPTEIPVSSEPRRWGAELKPVVNTSLPARLAPKLEPVTLAAATANTTQTVHAEPSVPLAPISIKHGKAAANVTSMEDFPSLGGKSTMKPAVSAVKPAVSAGTSFAALSRNWAQQQKEEDAKAKEEAEREAVWKQIQLKEREKEAKENRALSRISLGAIGILNQKKADSDDEKYFEDDHSIHSEDHYSSDEPVEEVYEDEDENEEDYVNDGTWDPRKHRDELY